MSLVSEGPWVWDTVSGQKILMRTRPRMSRQPRQPRLSVILLSDGFHNKGNEKNEFENLEILLKDNPQIIVHTLGYGFTPEELGKRIGKSKATRADLYYGSGRPPRGKINAEDLTKFLGPLHILNFKKLGIFLKSRNYFSKG